MPTTNQPLHNNHDQDPEDDRPYPEAFLAHDGIHGQIREEFLYDLIDDLHQLGFTDKKDVTDIEIEAVIVCPRRGGEELLMTIPITLWAYPVGDEMRLYDIDDLPLWKLHTDTGLHWGPEEAIVMLG